jgi:hypothetical protein
MHSSCSLSVDGAPVKAAVVSTVTFAFALCADDRFLWVCPQRESPGRKSLPHEFLNARCTLGGTERFYVWSNQHRTVPSQQQQISLRNLHGTMVETAQRGQKA